MPQHGIMGWRVGWPRWMDWSKAHKNTAVNKEMLETAIADAMGGPNRPMLPNLRFINAGGDSMRGALALSGDPVDPLHAATKSYVDAHPVDAGVY